MTPSTDSPRSREPTEPEIHYTSSYHLPLLYKNLKKRNFSSLSSHFYLIFLGRVKSQPGTEKTKDHQPSPVDGFYTRDEKDFWHTEVPILETLTSVKPFYYI